MNKHTPGPWVAHVSMIDEESGDEIILIRSEKPMRGITSIENESEEDEANARLIAAAPELLIACKVAITSCDPHDASTKYIKAIIAKAEGIEK